MTQALPRGSGAYTSDGRALAAADIDLNARVLSMGVFHHAIPGTAAIAIAAAAAVPGTVAAGRLVAPPADLTRIGHPSGRTAVGVEARDEGGRWTITRALMSRSARVLMEGMVSVPC